MRTTVFSASIALLLPLMTAATVLAGDVPNNLGLGLKDIAQDYRDVSAATASLTGDAATRKLDKNLRKALRQYSHIQLDAAGRVLVDVYADGSVPAAKLKKKFNRLGMSVQGAFAAYRNGVYAAWVPPAQIEKLATLHGVHSARLSPQPHYRVGQTTSQGAYVLHSDVENAAGYTGAGIKVGVLSDSFDDTAPQDPAGVPDDEALDIAMGDLPTAGVDVVLDDPVVATATDEGRAMCQIVHDVAPGAAIAFATAEGGESTFAANIIALGTPTGTLITGTTPPDVGHGCNIVCDDVSYLAEPMFSDGPIAQAIDTVAETYGVSYFSSAGNDGNSGYAATFNYTDPSTVVINNAVTTPDTPTGGLNFSYTPGGPIGLKTSGINPALYAGGFHSFGTDANGKPIVAQKVTAGSLAVSLVFQWDDPFDVGAVTTDYNILVFDATGAYQSGLSGTADNSSATGSDEPIEMPNTTLTASTTYYIVLCCGTVTTPAGNPVAKHLRYAAESDGGGFSGDFIARSNVETYGHNCAANCSGVAAYVYDAIPDTTGMAQTDGHVYTPLIESYSSNGPVDIYFDQAGNRLAEANHRRQPAFAAIDGVNTSFFPPATGNVILPGGVTPPAIPPFPITPPVEPPISPTIGTNPNDYDGDGFPNFFGTSAAAPHAAAVAALIMQAALPPNGPGVALTTTNSGVLPPSYIRTLLQSTTQGVIDTDPAFCEALGTNGGYTVDLTAAGDTSTDPNTFAVTLTNVSGTAGYQLTSLFINLLPSKLVFDENATTGYPFTQGNVGAANAGGATLMGATAAAPQETPQPTLSTDRTQATVLFTGFSAGDVVTFGVDRDVLNLNAYGNGVDQLQNSTFAATLTNPTTGGTLTVNGNFNNVTNRLYNFKAGYGLIDARAAINRLLGQ